MISKWQFTNAETAFTYTFQDDSSPPDYAPATHLDVFVNERATTSRYKMQGHGAWPTFTYRGEMTLDLTGDLYHDTSDQYIAERRSLIAALHGVPNTQPTVRNKGRLTVLWAGDAEDSYVDCTVIKTSIPQQGIFPALSQYMITFVAFDPFFTFTPSLTTYYFS